MGQFKILEEVNSPSADDVGNPEVEEEIEWRLLLIELGSWDEVVGTL